MPNRLIVVPTAQVPNRLIVVSVVPVLPNRTGVPYRRYPNRMTVVPATLTVVPLQLHRLTNRTNTDIPLLQDRLTNRLIVVTVIP